MDPCILAMENAARRHENIAEDGSRDPQPARGHERQYEQIVVGQV